MKNSKQNMNEIIEKIAQHSYGGYAMRLNHQNTTVGTKKQNPKQVQESPVIRTKRIFSRMTFANTNVPASQPLHPKSSTKN